MADLVSNTEENVLKPDNKEDEGLIASKNLGLLQMQQAEQKAMDMAARKSYTGAGIPGSTGGSSLMLDPIAAAQAVAAGDAALGKTDDSFPVQLSGSPVDSRIPKFLRNQASGSTPLDTLVKDGFLGLTDQNIIDKVVGIGSGKVEAYDPIFKMAVQTAALKSKAGTPTTVEEILDQWQKGGLPENLKRYLDGSGGSGGPFSTTTRSVSLTNEGTARQLVNNALTKYLGREATVSENRAFLQALNVQEKMNPSVSVVKGSTTGRNTDQTQMTTGGFDRNDFADRFAKSQQGYAEYQTATTYLDAFINALESDSRVI